MKNLQIINPNFIIFNDDFLNIDVLGGIDLRQIERMFTTLRITYGDYPPMRTTLDLYNDHQTDKLIRNICDKWQLKLLDVSKSIHQLITQLETYRLQALKYTDKRPKNKYTLSADDKKQALKYLKSKNLLKNLVSDFNQMGIIGENDNATILFMAMASHKYNNPFSVICLAKSGIGKSYILQKLSECMPNGSYSFHTQISPNALYYFNSHDIHQKALFIEDLEWTTQMLSPLATLQTQGKLVKTRATKDKDGMLHSTTFEVSGNLCLLACAYSDKNYESLSLPFLMIHLNHSHSQDIAVMEYQKKVKAGLIATTDIQQAQKRLKNLIATLENLTIINPYATMIELPDEINHPRKSLLLLLNFIEVVTFFHQYQRKQTTDKETGEIYLQTHPDDIALAFSLLKNSLFRRADELSTTARGFYNWLKNYLTEAKTDQFTALDIRKEKAIHPRTLNRYLNELKLYSYIQIVGGNKHRGGYRYKITDLGDQNHVNARIEKALQNNLNKIRQAHQKQQAQQEKQNQKTPRKTSSKTVGQNPLTDYKPPVKSVAHK